MTVDLDLGHLTKAVFVSFLPLQSYSHGPSLLTLRISKKHKKILFSGLGALFM